MQDINFRYDLLPLKDKLFRLALRITQNRQEAEDITSDTLVRIWNKRDELAEVDNLEAYAYRVCRNLSLDSVSKKEAQNVSLDNALYDAEDNGVSVQEQIERDEKLKKVHRIIADLPERQRSIIQLRDIEGKSYKEIAEILDLTEEVVKVTLFRARQKIRVDYQKFESYGL